MSEILLLGVSDAGKTVYGAQLLGRFENPSSSTALRLRDTPESYRVLQAAHEALQQGQYPDRTSYDTHERISLPLVDAAGRPVELNWPEFAGEAFKDRVIEQRYVPETWVERTRNAGGMLLMIRPSRESDAPGVGATSAGVVDRTQGTDAEDTGPVTLAPDARYVEVMQLFLFARDASRRERVGWPLAIVLSCWDEVDDGTLLPESLLSNKYPLLSVYLRGAWSAENIQVFGLSATGRQLVETDGYDARFVDEDPSCQGYVVVETGERRDDLTLPIAWLMERMRVTEP